MSDIKLCRIHGPSVSELDVRSVELEKSVQALIERNLETLLGVTFLATEHRTGPTHSGRIDTLGVDENNAPVIIEYKRSTNENVINQGLFYLDWLLDHKADFKLLVMEKCGTAVADRIDWSAPRLVCIAGDFTRYDEHAVQQINRNIELLRYRRFGSDLLLLQLVNRTQGFTSEDGGRGPAVYRTISETLQSLSGQLLDLYEALKTYVESLGDDVQVKTLKNYVAFRRIKNFACVEAHTSKGCLTVYTKVDPDTVSPEDGFTRDVRKIGHFGTGDLEITIRNQQDLERAKPLLIKCYEVS
jgi:predicted transport protein